MIDEELFRPLDRFAGVSVLKVSIPNGIPVFVMRFIVANLNLLTWDSCPC